MIPHLTRALLVAVTMLVPLSAQDGRNVSAYDRGAEHLALTGYDPVAYFDEGGGSPQKGKAEFAVEHEGVSYRFASNEHAQLFAQDPARYEPAFGGWCAYAMSLGKRVSIDPRAFRIGEGRLLLFADTDYVLVDGKWVPKEHELLAKADDAWTRLSGEAPRKAPAGTWRATDDFNLSQDSLAIEGYDPVSYFPEGGGKPTKGKADLVATHLGVKYRFASEAHRKLFVADPERFEPRHGGWCSYAMGAKAEKVEVDPTAFRLTNGQLHLFYVGWLSDTREDWDDDTAALKRNADANWEKTLQR